MSKIKLSQNKKYTKLINTSITKWLYKIQIKWTNSLYNLLLQKHNKHKQCPIIMLIISKIKVKRRVNRPMFMNIWQIN